MRTKILFFSTFVILSAALAGVVSISGPKISAKSDKFRRSERPIPNRYIVVLNETDANGVETRASERAIEHARGFSMRVEKVFESALKGYSVEMTAEDALALSSDPEISYIEEDSKVAPSSIQANATWGLSRIDQRAWTYPQDTNYEYALTGAGVNVYVIDTGVKVDHPDFGGRAANAANTSGDNTRIEDCNGHGTHVAGTVGSSTFGVAKGVNIHSVRVFPCWGNTPVSNVIAGIDWVVRHGVQPAVANLSLGTSYSRTLNDAVRSLITRGITATVAAGNDNRDACLDSPASLSEAITVGGTDNRDYKSYSSNFGRCVDIFAPGTGIESIWNQDQYPVFLMSGTSAAAPHAAGVAALYLQSAPTASPQQVRDAVIQNSTPDVVTQAGLGSPNLLLYSGFLGTGEVPPPPPPPAPDPNLCTGLGYTGTLDFGGAINYQSSSNGFSGSAGTYSGRLTLPSDATFVLSLEQKKGRSWTVVASSPGTTASESLTFKGKSGTYRWRVRSVYGSGNYELCSVTP